VLCAFIRLRRDDDDSEERMNMIVDCHFHIDETMLTLEKMIEGMDQNQVAKTALIAPMNETMFEKDSTIQHRIQNLFRSRILHVPPIGFPIYDGLVRDGLFNLYGQSYKIFPKPNNNLVARNKGTVLPFHFFL